MQPSSNPSPPQSRLLRCLSPSSWFGALMLFFFPWMEISCIDDKGKVTSRETMSGAQFVVDVSTDSSKKPALFDEELDTRLRSGKCLLALYALALTVCLSFVLLRCSLSRARVGFLCSLLVLTLLLSGNWCLLVNPVSPPKPWRFMDGWVVTRYTPWYYASYAANAAALLCFGIEWFVMRKRLSSG